MTHKRLGTLRGRVCEAALTKPAALRSQSSDRLSFLISSPTKALCDGLVLSHGLGALSRGYRRQRLLEDLRLDSELLGQLNLADIHGCLATRFKHRPLVTMLAVVEALQGKSH